MSKIIFVFCNLFDLEKASVSVNLINNLNQKSTWKLVPYDEVVNCCSFNKPQMKSY